MRDEQSRRIEEFRRLIADEIRRHLVEIKGLHEAADVYHQRLIEDVDFLAASPAQLREMRYAIRPLAHKLAARIARRRRFRRHGRLEVRKTMRRSLSAGGVPLDPAFRYPKVTKPDVAEINRETLPSSFDGEIEYIDISSVTPGSINETTRYDFRDAPSRARRVVQHGDIIWSCVRPNRRSHAVIWQPGPSLIASTGFGVITPKAVPTAFLYQATTTDAFVGYLENHARGAAYPAVVASDFERAELLVPRVRLVGAFNEQAEPLLSQGHTLRLQNEKLRAARDLLLPRLMSGEIAV